MFRRMTVKELIEQLQEIENKDLKVCIEDVDYWWHEVGYISYDNLILQWRIEEREYVVTLQ